MIAMGMGAGRIPNHCAWCGRHSQDAFCKPCYGLIDGETKCSMRSLIAKAAPQRARRLGIACLLVLEKAGVPVPERRSDRESEVAA